MPGLVMLAALVVPGCRAGEPPVSGAAPAVAGQDPPAGADRAALVTDDPRALLEHFAALWVAGDEAALSAVASEQVTGQVASLGPVRAVRLLWDEWCVAGSHGSGSCDLSVERPGGTVTVTADYVIEPGGASYVEWLTAPPG